MRYMASAASSVRSHVSRSSGERPKGRPAFAGCRLSSAERRAYMGKGLEGVVAASTAISYIDGLNGRLFYRGIDINELAERSTFEETTALLWYGKLPTRQQ